MGRRAETGRCPAGYCRMSKIGEASSGHRANFNCELNLPGRRLISARLGLCRRITAGFLPDGKQNSPHGGHRIDFSLFFSIFV